jgi:hypothetical protein
MKKMYNPQNAKENGLPPDMVFDGVVIDLKDKNQIYST